MRVAVAAVAFLLLAGCSGAPARDVPTSGTQSSPGTGGPSAVQGVVDSPVHGVGTSWTYRGQELYSSDTEFTVVVAEAGPSGYLFAAGAPDDLVYHALWGSHWFGPHGADLDAPDGDDLLAFPLTDGKSWEWREGRQVTARAAPIQTPRGADEGFVIEGEGLRYEYSPTMGQVVRWQRDYGGELAESWEMVAAGRAQAATWYVPGELVVVPDPHAPQAFELADGHDAVLVSAGGMRGSRAIVVPPSGQPHVAEFPAADETWMNAILAPEAGRWEAMVAGRPFVDGVPWQDVPLGWAYMHVMPVEWVETSLPA